MGNTPQTVIITQSGAKPRKADNNRRNSADGQGFRVEFFRALCEKILLAP